MVFKNVQIALLDVHCLKGNPLPARVSITLDLLSSAMSTRCLFYNTRGDFRF